MKDYTARKIPDQSGRTALVTGANTGIGLETALVLARRGARVLLGCRSAERAAAARERILRRVRAADVELLSLDLGSLASIEEAAARARREARLDLLINNAGIMIPPREETADGFESQFGVNHLGHFALTGRLLPKLRKTRESRIVTVSSAAHKGGSIDFADIQAQRSYSRVGRYSMSKLANLLFTFELQRRLAAAGGSTIALACHPGISETELSRHFPPWLMLIGPMFRLFQHSPANAALPSLRAATDPQAQGGQYYGPRDRFETAGPPVLAEPSSTSRDEALARRLWDVSIELTGVDPRI